MHQGIDLSPTCSITCFNVQLSTRPPTSCWPISMRWSPRCRTPALRVQADADDRGARTAIHAEPTTFGLKLDPRPMPSSNRCRSRLVAESVQRSPPCAISGAVGTFAQYRSAPWRIRAGEKHSASPPERVPPR